MDTEADKDFFLSYTSLDQRWAEWIAWQLEAANYTVVLQAWDFLPGSNFVLNMEKATRNAVCTIVLLSPDYFTSRFTFAEWTAAFQRDPTGERGLLLPIRVRPCDIEGSLLGPISYIDLVDQQDEQGTRRALLRGVERQRRRPRTAPAFPLHSQREPDHPPFPGTKPSLWNVPYPRNPYFTGREKVLTHVAENLRAGKTIALSQPLAISGLGGIGKTQIALEYVYRYFQDYQAVFWTRADTTEALIAGFVAISELLQVSQKEEQDQRIAVQAVIDWLTSHTRWLLILDNADDLTVLQEFLPLPQEGHILLTTRAASMGRLASRIEVETLTQNDGILFVLRRAGVLEARLSLDHAPPEQVTLARNLVQEMGGLPLALDQAGAYIEETQCSLLEYLGLYRQHRMALLKERGGWIPDHPESVVTTWSLSFARIEQSNPIAADVLRVCAFLHPDAIPEELFYEGASCLGPHIQIFTTDKKDLIFNEAIKALLAYSLIRRNATGHFISIHQLVQAVLQDSMDEATRRVWIERIICAVRAVTPDQIDYSTWEHCERYLPHAQHCVQLIDQWQLDSQEAIELLYITGMYLANRARYAEAEALYLRALRIWEQTLGPDHFQVASPLNSLAILYSEQGKHVEAEPLYVRALLINKQALGPNHPLVVCLLNNLAHHYSDLGKDTEAEPLYRQALDISEQAQGSDQSQMISSLYGLARLYAKQEKYEEAESLYLRAHQISEQVLGPEHPQVAFQLEGLADLYSNQGKEKEAEPLYLRALQIWEQALGPEHLQLTYTLQRLAFFYTRQKKYTEAEPLYLRALQVREQVLGPDHPLTRKTASRYRSLQYAMQQDTEK